jgi:hypothetical protein
VVDTPENEDVNSLSVAHDEGIFTHLLETRKSFLLSEIHEREPPPEPVQATGKLNTGTPSLSPLPLVEYWGQLAVGFKNAFPGEEHITKD